jgi:hypothetical protein
MHFGPVPVLAWYITGTGFKWCPCRYWHFCTLVQYQHGHGPLPVLALNGASTGIGIFAVLSDTSIGTVHYWYCHYLVPYQYWHFSTLVKYQYWHGPLQVLAINGVSTGIGIYAFWSSTSIGMVHHRCRHLTVPVPVLAFLHSGPVPVWARFITCTSIKWCQYRQCEQTLRKMSQNLCQH